MTAATPELAARRGFVARSLDLVERVGNRLPDPAVLFLLLMFVVWGVSWAMSGISFSAIDPRTGNPIAIKNLLAGTALTDFMAAMVNTFVIFPPLGVVLVAMLGLGVAEHTGFISAALRAALVVTPRMLLTPALIAVAVLSHIAVDAGYVLVIPLGAVIFYAAGRHPLAGVAAAFVGGSSMPGRRLAAERMPCAQSSNINPLPGRCSRRALILTNIRVGLRSWVRLFEGESMLHDHRIRNRFVVMVAVALSLAPTIAQAVGARLFKSGPIQITADGRDVWMVHPDNDSVAHLDTLTNLVTEYPLPAGLSHAPRGLSVREDGSELWVACHDSDRVYVIAGTGSNRGTVIAEVAMPLGSGPYSVALSRDQVTALVTLHRKEALAIVDTTSRSLTFELAPVYHGSMGVTWAEDGVSAWVTHVFADGEHPFLTRVDFSGPTPKVKSHIRVLATQPQNSGSQTTPRPAEGGYLTHRAHTAQIPTSTGRQELWIPTQYNNIHNDQWDPDSTIQTTLRHLYLPTRQLPNCNNNCGQGCAGMPNKVVFSAPAVHCPNGNNPYDGPGWDAHVSGPVDIGFSANGSMAYILNELSNDLLVVPSNTPSVRPATAPPLVEVAVGDRPIGLTLSPTRNLAYVLNELSRDVSVIDLGTAPPVEVQRIAATPVTGEPMSPNVHLGARLFHTSADPRISINEKVACASCHINAEHDGRQWSLQNLPSDHGDRSVQTLRGLSTTMGPIDPTTGFGQLHLSGDRDEVQDFEHTFRGEFMRGTGFVASGLCPDVNPPDPLCTNRARSPELDAVSAYLMSLLPLQKSPNRRADGTLTEAAVRGATFFMGANRASKPADAGCAGCHMPPLGPAAPTFADRLFHDIGRRSNSEEELNNRAPWNWYVGTQPLVGLWSTPPWEGTANYPRSSMIDLLLEFASRANSATPHGTPDGLTRRQLRDLAEFVLSIDGQTGAEVFQADTTPPRIVRVEPASLTQVDVWFSETVDPATAGTASNWQILDSVGNSLPIFTAVFDPQNGDRVTLTTQLLACSAASYTVVPSGNILDAAATASGGTANRLDPNDPGNTRGFTINGTITVTLGSSGYENITIPVHDSAMIDGLNTWSHDTIYLANRAVGFVRFDWVTAFRAVTGVTASTDILDASFALKGEFGDVQPLEVRRTLQPWSDPATGGDWNQNPVGGPTWNAHQHPNGLWNQAGARALGGTGTVLSDYRAQFDRAASIDLLMTPQAVNERVVFASPAITDGFRFWFDNPTVDFGYAVQIVTPLNEIRYHGWEHEVYQHGPVLHVTYQLPAAPPAPGEVSGLTNARPLYVTKASPSPAQLRFSFENLGVVASSYNLYEGTIGNYYSHAGGSGCGLLPTPAGSRQELLRTWPTGSSYFIVTASNTCAEGPSNIDHPTAMLDCLP